MCSLIWGKAICLRQSMKQSLCDWANMLRRWSHKRRTIVRGFAFEVHRDIQLYLVSHDIANFDELVDKAKTIKDIKVSWTEVGKQVSRQVSKRDHDS